MKNRVSERDGYRFRHAAVCVDVSGVLMNHYGGDAARRQALSFPDDSARRENRYFRFGKAAEPRPGEKSRPITFNRRDEPVRRNCQDDVISPRQPCGSRMHRKVSHNPRNKQPCSYGNFNCRFHPTSLYWTIFHKKIVRVGGIY